MSRPVYEPSDARQDAAQAWASRQLFRRPAPRGASGVEAVDLRAWNYDDTNEWPSVTWRNVANITNESYYEDTCYTTDSLMIPDFDAGVTIGAIGGVFACFGWVQFNEDGDPGETRAASITQGGTVRHINVVTEGATSDITDNRYIVSATIMKAVEAGTLAITLEAWHDSGDTRTLRDAALTVVRLTDRGDMTCESRP